MSLFIIDYKFNSFSSVVIDVKNYIYFNQDCTTYICLKEFFVEKNE